MNWPALIVSALLGVVASTIVRWTREHRAEWQRARTRRTELRSDKSDLARRIKKTRKAHRNAVTPAHFKEENAAYAALRAMTPEKLAKFHKAEADFLWPRQDRASSYRTAFHYQLAYEAARQTQGMLKTACDYAHFAGHRFRQLDEYQRAADAYEDSAALAFQANPSLAARPARRAMGCWTDVAEYERARMVADRYGLEWPAERLSDPL